MGMTCLTRAAAHTSCLFIHHSCLWGHLRPQRAASSASTVERAGLWTLVEGRPGHFLPSSTLLGRGWWRAAGDSTPLYRQNLLSTIWPLGRQVPAGRRPARNLQAGRSRCRREEERDAGAEKDCCRRVESMQAAQLVHRNDCFSPLQRPLPSHSITAQTL